MGRATSGAVTPSGRGVAWLYCSEMASISPPWGPVRDRLRVVEKRWVNGWIMVLKSSLQPSRCSRMNSTEALYPGKPKARLPPLSRAILSKLSRLS